MTWIGWKHVKEEGGWGGGDNFTAAVGRVNGVHVRTSGGQNWVDNEELRSRGCETGCVRNRETCVEGMGLARGDVEPVSRFRATTGTRIQGTPQREEDPENDIKKKKKKI